MKKLKEILNKEKHLWFYVKPQDFKKFLLFAKQNGCKWIGGGEISPDNDECGHFMGINTDLQMGYVPAMCWFYAKDKIRKVEFNSSENFQVFIKKL